VTRRLLIVNADDFGLSPGVNRGIVQAHEQGIVTSASLMVRWPAAAEAAAYACAHPELSLGLHLDLGQRAFRAGRYRALYQVVPLDDPTAVAEEAARQLASFRRLVGRSPSHLDSHQHVHRRPTVGQPLAELARTLGVPLREYAPAIRFCGAFYGQTARGTPLRSAIGVESLLQIVARLAPGITELMCHPGDGSPLDAAYVAERAEELRALCDPRVRTALAAERIELRAFHDLQAADRAQQP
jgi:predicted glycoside hydrolase/deacetylase ChbG (UPF0249 family)